MPTSESLTRAATNVVTQSLGLRKDQGLLIFADPGSVDVADVVAETANDLGVITTVLYVPHLLQSRFDLHESLPLPTEAAIREADAVLSCLSDRPEHLAYRLRVLRTSWGRRTKLAHAPGLTLDILRMADTNYDLIHERCQLLALALVLGKQIEVISADHRGQEFRLIVELGGWESPPGISDGIIPDGAWANLPPGETYIVPKGAVGKIVINGSMPGRVLGPGEGVVLEFQAGRLAHIHPENSPAARYLHDTQIAYAQRHGDSNWSNLAEVGFGVNPAVRQLIGTELVDEKKANTLHIALGHSASLGGRVESAIHCDLVVEQPTVRVDGKLLLKTGQWQVNEEDWRPDHNSVVMPEGWWESVTMIRRSGIRAERDNGCLLRRWTSGHGRRDSMPVGTERTARLAAELYDLLPERGDTISKEALLDGVRGADLEKPILPALLWIMRQYGLVRFPGELVP